MNLLRPLVKSDLRVFGLFFSAILLTAFIYALWQPRLYQANAALQFYPRPPTLGIEDVSVKREDPGLLIGVMKSSQLLKRVVTRLTDEERTFFFKPYLPAQVNSDEGSVEALIRGNQTLVFKANILTILYRHPDRFVAARMANLLAEEAIEHHERMRIDETKTRVEELNLRIEAYPRLLKDLEEDISYYRSRHTTNTSESIEGDVKYQALQKRLSDNQKMLELIEKVRYTIMISGAIPEFWRMAQKAVPPGKSDYLIDPIVRRLRRGLGVAVVGGLLAVGVVNIFTRGRELADNQKEAA